MTLATLIACSLWSSGPRTVVLTYHDIIPKRDRASVWFDCTVDEFRSQIKFFRTKGAEFISIEELKNRLQKGKRPSKPTVCLTFADNYFGFYKYAWPILKKERIPVAQFVHTGFVGSTKGRPKMTWAQLKELKQSGLVIIASQTVSHPADLTALPDSEISKEFYQSKMRLESQLGGTVAWLAYPNGKFDRRVAKLAQKAGYSIAFTEECLPAEESADMFTVPRYVHTKYRSAWRDSFGR